ncbi:MAG: phosphate signaling complex protein PhoU [candidate division WOR-3 bacterium]|jgi:phosphate transport system protein|nr:phosphate signaling complex protein PhoU [candidate division WOR-3 bacterium]MCR4423725.1 phosphate signaling complex protein PhoU [candidate division WOR-3 bacterium]MDH7519064.1 phosphate signaling complex protein PhoU [bacterium]
MTLLEEKIAVLKEKLLAMAAAVENMVDSSIQALVKKDHQLAEKVINEIEPKINQEEIEIEDTAINLIALHQPEASNLRTITMVIKINNDLERIGDHAVNIAEAALFLIPRPAVKPLIDLPRMAQHTIQMLSDSLDAFTKKDAELARQVCARDSIVDSLKDQISRELITYMTSDATTIDRALKLMLISLNLERIADLATNISEDVVYAVTGAVIKHGKCEFLT